MPLAEKSLLAALRRRALIGPRSPVRLGMGDDCAVLHVPPGHETLITTDFSLEGVHFRRDWQPPESIGHRCLTRGLSDIAAMGGTPLAAFLSLALPRNLTQRWVDRFFDGFLALAKTHGVELAGGDTAQSPQGIMADVIVLGSSPRRRAIRRSGARPGDLIYVTGVLGHSAYAIRRLQKGGKLTPSERQAYLYPQPRIEAGEWLLRRKLPSAMIDISDGLSTDLGHICEESGVGAELDAPLIPTQHSDLSFALHGGDDYELLFTAPPSRKIPRIIAGAAITKIGRITRAHGMSLTNGTKRQPLKPEGWEQFG